MSNVRTIDTHTHVLTEETAALLRKEAPKVPVTITPIDAASATLDVGGVAYRPFPTGGFDIAHRLRDMDEAGVDVQVLSATPQTYLYNQEAALGVATSALQNDQIAKLVKDNPRRFMGIATLPMQAPEKAADELRRAMTKLGLRGTMFASNIMGKNLDDPSFDPLWATAEELGAFVFIHPNNVAGADRLKSYYLQNLIGNPLDTTIALSHLIFDGTLDRFPRLKLCAAHGGGYLPSYADRSDHGCLTFPEACKPFTPLKKKPTEYLRQLYVDSLVFTPEALRHLIAQCGVSQIMIGTDFPYPWTATAVDHILGTPSLSAAEREAILGGNAAKLLRIPT
jgi:aminocarboxymuconate-semialdehyde decarboxylase